MATYWRRGGFEEVRDLLAAYVATFGLTASASVWVLEAVIDNVLRPLDDLPIPYSVVDSFCDGCGRREIGRSPAHTTNLCLACSADISTAWPDTLELVDGPSADAITAAVLSIRP